MVLVKPKRESTSNIQKLEHDGQSEEVMVVCPQCKAIQSVLIKDGILMPTRKFRQVRTRIYHDCGSSHPCRIYRDW